MRTDLRSRATARTSKKCRPRSERYYGRQFRSFTLAHDIDEAKSEAEYNDGVLKLTLPKKASAETKKLAIK